MSYTIEMVDDFYGEERFFTLQLSRLDLINNYITILDNDVKKGRVIGIFVFTFKDGNFTFKSIYGDEDWNRQNASRLTEILK